MAPKVSILVAVYNVADHVESALQSALAQTERDLEVIVIDDGSTDGSSEIADRIAASDARMRVIHQTNAGLGAARNVALAEACGNWVAFLDGDDALAPDFVAQLLSAAQETGASWVAGGVEFVMGDHRAYRGPLSGGGETSAPSGTVTRLDLPDWSPATQLLTATWNKLYRRDLIADLTFDEGVWFEDYTFFMKLIDRTEHIGILDSPVYLHLRHREGQITGADDDRVFDHFTVMEAIASVLQNSTKPGGTDAQDRLEGRLLDERLPALRSKQRRQRFLDHARDRFDGRRTVLTSLMHSALSDVPTLSIVIPWDGDEAPLQRTLARLEGQVFRDFEVLVVSDKDADAPCPSSDVFEIRHSVQPGHGPGHARNHGLPQCQGTLVVFLDAGALPEPWVLYHWCDQMLVQGTDMGVSAFHTGPEPASATGFRDAADLPAALTPFQPTPTTASDVIPEISAMIFRRICLQTQRFRFGPDNYLGSWPVVSGALLSSTRVLYFPTEGVVVRHTPGAEAPHTAPVRQSTLAAALNDLAVVTSAFGHIPPGWMAGQAARAIWDQATDADHASPNARRLFVLQAALAARWRYGSAPDLPPEIRGLIRTVMSWPESRNNQN